MSKVSSGCYGYAIKVSPSVHVRVFISSMHTFPEILATYRRRQTLYLVHYHGFSQDLRDEQVEVQAYAICVMWGTLVKLLPYMGPKAASKILHD